MTSYTFHLSPPPQAMNVVVAFTIVPIAVAILFILILKFSGRSTIISPINRMLPKPVRIAIAAIAILIVIFMLVYGMLPAFYESYISIDDGKVGIHQPGLFPLHKEFSREQMVKAYVDYVIGRLGDYKTRIFGTYVSKYAIGIFELSNGKRAYVASVDPLGENLIIELRD